MKFISTINILFLLSAAVTSLSLPQSDLAIRHASIIAPIHEASDLEKRRGGGGGGRGGSGGGGGGRGGRGGTTSSTSTSSTSNIGGKTPAGSGPRPIYGGGYYYGGGAVTPYRSGRPSPLGIAPFFLPIAALAFFPGIWLYGAYIYPYHHPYYYVNSTTHQNESMPVLCLCQQYQVCGCDDNNNSTYYESLFNGTQPKNTSIVTVANVNGTMTIAINGTLPNGTTAADPSLSSATRTRLIEASGYWVMVALVASTVWAL